MMDYKNETELGHILTIEDPIEFVHQSKKCLVNQREVHRDTHGFNKTIDRIVDVFPAGEKPMVRSMLSESLKAVISQTLLKKEGGGRVAAHEIMMGTPAIRNLIREDKVAQMYSAIQTGQSAGMQTLDQNLQKLVQKGVVSLEDARKKAANPESIT